MTKEDDVTWRKFLTALSKGTRNLDLAFEFNDSGWEGLAGGRAAELVAHLPATVSRLTIWNALDRFGVRFVAALLGTPLQEPVQRWFDVPVV